MIRLTPFEKAVKGLSVAFRSFELNPEINPTRWNELMYKHVSSSRADQKHATQMLLERGAISPKDQGGFIVHLDMLKGLLEAIENGS